LGRVADLPTLVQRLQVHEVVVAMKQSLTDELIEVLIRCQGRGVQVSWMPDLYEKICRSVPVRYIDNSWALSAIQGKPIFNRLQLIAKRCLDLVIIVGALPVLLLMMPVIALAIYLDSPGPIFYQQIRVGRGGELFTIFKFRTMIPDAEKNSTPQWATEKDPRITRVGWLLRKMRLDELPQLLNILRGEMSFVGPRPERPEFVADLEQKIPFYRTRLLVKPGLTGWAQIHYGYGNSVEHAMYKLQFDFYYIHHWSLWKDIYILFRTFAVVFQLKGT
jgi:exopolysaccharide biosynthesis polyprenyl glycosylphosphotransferase